MDEFLQIDHLMTLVKAKAQHRVFGDLLVTMPESPDDDDFDEAALMREIEEGTRGITFSDIIIEERREGP